MKAKLLLSLFLFCADWAIAQTSGIYYVPIQRRKAGVVEYKRAKRDYSVYPANTTGTNAWTLALTNGSIPVENRPGPNWADARVTYLESKRYLQVEVQSQSDVQLQFDRVDNTALVGSNPDGVILSSGTFYGPGGTGLVDYTKQWAFGQSADGSGGIPSVPIRLSFKNLNTGEVYTHVFTPIDRASRAQLFVAGNASPPVLAGGYGEGSVSGLMASAPFVPTTNQYSTWGYGGMTRQYLDNGQIKAGFAKALGGTLDFLSDGSSGPNLLNNNSQNATSTVEGQIVPDDGRQAGPAIYATPSGAGIDPYTEAGQTLGLIGWNGVVGGSINQNHSVIHFYERRTVTGYGDVLYFKTQPQQWEGNNLLCRMYIHSWYWLEGRSVRYFYIIENFRNDSQMHYVGRGQELPFAYVIAPYYRYFIYSGNSPGTGGALQQINVATEPCEGGGDCNQNDTGEFNSTENWIGALNSSNNGVFIVTPYNSRFNGKQFQRWSGDASTNASAYINAISTGPFDIPNYNQAFTGYFYVGSLSSFRSWYSGLNMTKRPFDFKFDSGKTQGWYSGNAQAKFNSSGEYVFSIGQRRGDGQAYGSFVSPWGSWNASDIPTLYIKAKISGVSQIYLQWRRPGETVFQSATNNRTITITGDGNVHTYAISMAGYTNWSGYITQVSFQNPNPNDSGISTSATFTPVYIGNQNPD